MELLLSTLLRKERWGSARQVHVHLTSLTLCARFANADAHGRALRAEKRSPDLRRTQTSHSFAIHSQDLVSGEQCAFEMG
jgi:hypothetical protein